VGFHSRNTQQLSTKRSATESIAPSNHLIVSVREMETCNCRVFHSSVAPSRASARLRVVSQKNHLGQIPSAPCASAAARKHQSHPWGYGRITWRSAAVTRFMSTVPESGRLQLPVSGVLRVKSVFSPVRGAWVESNLGPYPSPGFNCIDALSHPS